MDPNYHRQQRVPDHRAPPDPRVGRMEADTVQDAQRLLATYPFASATPTTHVARHLGNMSIANPPSYMQPQYYTANGAQYQQGGYQPSGEYSNELRYLSNAQPPANDGGYWRETRNDALRYLGEQGGSAYTQYPPPSHYGRPPAPSAYHTNAISQSIFQHTTPSASYPTPPPPGMSFSSSSLAHALEEPQSRPARTIYPREQSFEFFDNVLAQEAQWRDTHRTPRHEYRPSETAAPPQTATLPPWQGQRHEVSKYTRNEPRMKSAQRAPVAPVSLPPVEQRRPEAERNMYGTNNATPPLPKHIQRREVVSDARSERTVAPPSVVPVPAPPTHSHAPASGSKKRRDSTQRPTPPPSVAQFPPSSPDPLALPLSSPVKRARYSPAPADVTPRKRKLETQLDSPSVKRLQATPSTTSSVFSSRSTASSLGSVIQNGSDSFTTPTGPSHSTVPATTPGTGRSLKMLYVEVPRKHHLMTPSSMSPPAKGSARPKETGTANGPKSALESDDDLGGYGSEEQYARMSSVAGSSAVKSSTKKTGGRDDRGPLEKLASFIEDIFEAEDSLPPHASPEDLPAEFFSPLTQDPAHPLLHPNVVRKLTKYIGRVARPTKRMRLSARDPSGGTPRSKEGVAHIETPVLSRILRILERSVRPGEDLEPFAGGASGGHAADGREKTASPTKKRGKAGKKGAANGERRSKSKTPKDGDEDGAAEDAEVDARGVNAPADDAAEATDADCDTLTRTLDIAKDSVLAAECCLALLTSDRLTKQLYSEDLITACLSAIKNQLTKVVYPFIEASPSAAGVLSPLLRHLIKPVGATASIAKGHRRQLTEVYQAVSAALPRINHLVYADAVAMSDTIIIQAVYISIGPFFVVEGDTEAGSKGKKENVVVNTLGASAMRGIRLDALSLIRSIFANHEDQRSWIIEEILSSLIKLSDNKQKAGQFRLRDGHSIRTVSALLLQLVQTSAHDVRVEARRLGKARVQQMALRRQESMTYAADAKVESFLDDQDLEEIRLYGAGLESAMKAAKTIVVFLTQRSGKTKSTKNSNEAEYRTIFDNLISDLLVVLFWPEWPAASLLLNIICKFMVSSLDDVKTSQNENNAVKSIALDHLGIIAAKLKSTSLKFKPGQQNSEGELLDLTSLDDILARTDEKQLKTLVSAHHDVVSHLCKRSSEDQAFESARDLMTATWGQELSQALKRVNGGLDEEDDLALPNVDLKRLSSFGQKLKAVLRDVWKDPVTDVFNVGSAEDVARVDLIAEQIGSVQGLKNLFNPVLNVVLQALDAPPVFMRTKALRCLGQIVTSDPSILSASNVRHAIESHLLDSSAAVRDAAVELIGRYMIETPGVAGDYYRKIADRIADTGMGVRKRVIKLLKSFYSVTDDVQNKIDICSRLVQRMGDEDDTVKDLAVKAVEDLWFPQLVASSASQKSRGSAVVPHDKTQLLSKVSVIMGVSANFKDRNSALEDMLHKIVADKEGPDAAALHSRYTEICEALIDGLVDDSDIPGFTVVNCIRAIHLLVSAHPAILSGSNASTLLPYLKNASSAEELLISETLLRIFRASIPHMPKTAAKFAQDLQLSLQNMILKPTSGSSGLQEAVACLCAVVHHLTHDFGRPIALLKSCNGRLRQAMARPKTHQMTPTESRSLSVLIFIVALLAEHCDFDRLRAERENFAADLNAVSKGSIIEHVYECLLQLYERNEEPAFRGRILLCLGFLFRAQPTLMTLESSASVMDAIFNSTDVEDQGRLLKIVQDFLISQVSKHADKQKGTSKTKDKGTAVNMDELIGNTDGFADSGVSLAIVQRYINQILKAALSKNGHIQAAAVDILSFTVRQGLAHPLQSFATIVALETSPNAILSTRANALHAILHSKHGTVLNARYIVSARESFEYQKQLASDPVQGYRMQPSPTSLLHRWYSLVREKRTSRQDFLRAMVKVFELKAEMKSNQDDVDFMRYMSENFSAFDYKTLEEVLTVIKHITSVLSTTGMQLVEAVSPNDLLAQLHSGSQDMDPDATSLGAIEGLTLDPAAFNAKLDLMRSSVIIAVLMLLKAHLKVLYGIAEDKCSKWVPGKKSALGDKSAVRKHERPISWDRLPFATVPILTKHDIEEQKTRFLLIWNEDGVTAEPEDDLP